MAGKSDIAILGGSFNPPHLAHQMVALWVLAARKASQVWLTPCYHHAFGKALAPFWHRVAMCEALCEALPPGKVQVSRVEAQHPAESRTLFTLRRLIKQHPGKRFALVIGSDILQERDKWYRFDEIERLVEVLVVGRSGYPSPPGAPVLPPISSTAIRRAVAAGSDVGHLVPAAVQSYIRKHDLYRPA